MTALLTADGLSFAIEKNLLLNKIALSVFSQDCVCILGENGAGKSTLLSLLAGFKKPSCGSVLLYNKKIESFSLTNRSEIISFLHQSSPQMFYMRVDEFLELRTYKKSNLEFLNFKIQPSLKTQYLNTLSEGQWQKIRIYQMFLANSRIIMLDEPTKSLDIEHQNLLISAIKNFTAQPHHAAIVVSHDRNFTKQIANRTFVLCQGHLCSV